MNLYEDPHMTNRTTELMRRFNEVFLRHDPAVLPELIADDCVIEMIRPAPAGDRLVGRDACVANWTAIATTPGSHFDLEEVFVAGDRAVIRWRFWSSDTESVRGVNLMRVRDGRIVEAMGYSKGA
ncbi:MAG: nuclear transport factor 2 family protein [Candidatus Binataceae bacterium]|nr:nuclear transport factor 2 family protein [Candidatus Binataceae bacterium]